MCMYVAKFPVPPLFESPTAIIHSPVSVWCTAAYSSVRSCTAVYSCVLLSELHLTRRGSLIFRCDSSL